jgi:alpha-beta hydrolase superfamily lysophospholipase
MRLRNALFCLSIPALAWFGVGAALSEGALHVRAWEPVARTIRPQYASTNLTGREVEIRAADGAALRGTFFGTPEGGECVLVLHGIADSREGAIGFAPMLLRAGYSVLAPDLRAHGRSGGERTTYGVLERDDTLRWSQWMRDQGCHRRYGLGASLGGAVLIQAATEPGAFDAIVAESSFRDLRSVAVDRVAQRLPVPLPVARLTASAAVDTGLAYTQLRYGLDLREASPQKAARAAQARLLLIHGLADTETPPDHSRAIAGAAPQAELWLVPNARHVAASATAPEDFRARVIGWFRQSR